jgi:hypothetical protein
MTLTLPGEEFLTQHEKENCKENNKRGEKKDSQYFNVTGVSV